MPCFAISRAAIFIFLLASWAAHAQPRPDLGGLWKREDGGIVRITQEADSIRMTHVEVVVAIQQEFGFNPGDEHAAVSVDGRRLVGKMHVRLPLPWKKLCPDEWDHWSPLELALSEDGNTISGRWEKSHFNQRTCAVMRKEWQPRQYTRLQEAPTGAPGSLRVATKGGTALASASFELILDASGSMWGMVEGRPKIEIAKETMRQVINGLPDDAQTALRVYGHRIAAGRPGACEDSELVFPLAKIDKARLIARIAGLRALGTTPIAYSLGHVAADLGTGAGEKMVVLVTDGKEECGGNPTRAVAALIEKGLKVQVNIVGFALAEEAAKSEMRRAAELSGGRFYDAAGARGLRDAIERALAVPYDVINAAGRTVAQGIVGKESIEVPPGAYTVVVNIPGKPMRLHDARVASGRLTSVEVDPREGRISTSAGSP